MMTTLLESKPQKKRSTGGTVLSVILHSAILFFAVYATARGGVARDTEPKVQKVNFVSMKKDPPPPPEVKKTEPPKVKKVVTEHNPAPLLPAPKTEIAPPKGFKVLQAPVNVPVDIPKIDLSAKITNEADFSGKGVAGGSGSGKEGSNGDKQGGSAGVSTEKPYMDYQVEQQVQPISGTQVSYPESLRSSGIEGDVQAQFVVNENGRVEIGTFKVLNSANPAFVQAVRHALPDMRFHAAKIGDTKVSQVVQQSFVFKLNHGVTG
jgi:periplasmic protein TonB